MKYEKFKGKRYLAGLLVCSLLFFVSFLSGNLPLCRGETGRRGIFSFS